MGIRYIYMFLKLIPDFASIPVRNSVYKFTYLFAVVSAEFSLDISFLIRSISGVLLIFLSAAPHLRSVQILLPEIRVAGGLYQLACLVVPLFELSLSLDRPPRSLQHGAAAKSCFGA